MQKYRYTTKQPMFIAAKIYNIVLVALVTFSMSFIMPVVFCEFSDVWVGFQKRWKYGVDILAESQQGSEMCKEFHLTSSFYGYGYGYGYGYA